MGWVRVDDHFDGHPKLARVGPIGWGFWLAGLAYCNRNLTDGFVPRSVARSLGDFEVIDGDDEVVRICIAAGAATGEMNADWVIDLLLSAGLWAKVPGGYVVHDFHDYQPSKERVLAERKAKLERQKRWRGRRPSNGGRDAGVDAPVDAPVDGGVDGGRDADEDPAPNPKPLRAKALSSEPRGSDPKATDEDKQLCRLLGELAKKRNPKFKVQSRSRWLTDMRLLRERDGNSPEEIERLIRWLFTDKGRDAAFWADVIRSPGNLREHFAQLWAKMQTPPSLRAVAEVEDSAAFLSRRGAA